MHLRHLFIYLFLCCCPRLATAQERTYRSESIRTAITKMGLAAMADTLRPGLSTVAYKDRTICLRKNSNHEVESIGMPLFSKTIRQLQPSPIYDFIEFALLDHTFSINDNPFTYRNFKFTKGSWRDLQQMSPNASVGINNIDGKQYKITWSLGRTVVAEVTFPVQYDMLSSSTRMEQEKNFIHDLSRYVPHPTPPENVKPKHRESLQLRFKNGNTRYYVCKGESLYTKHITDDTYYITGGDNVLRLLDDSRYAAETLCNALLTGASCDKEVSLTVMGQDFSQTNLRTKVSALAGFLQSSGCRNFFELKRNTGKELSFSVYAENKPSGYTHLLIFTCTPGEALGGKTPLAVKAFLFIPTSNIKSLYEI